MKKNLIISLISILLLLGALEGIAWIFVGAPKTERHQLSHEYGWGWTPEYQFGKVKISDQGLRNDPIVIPKPAQLTRVLVIGDSITAGVEVEAEETFVKVLERKLDHTEVINAGVESWTAQQEVAWLKEEGLKFEPDIVIIGVYLNDGQIVVNPPTIVAVAHNFFINQSAAYNYYYRSVLQARAKQDAAQPNFTRRFIKTMSTNKNWMTDSEELEKVFESATQDWASAWTQNEMGRIQAEMEKAIQLSRNHHFKLILVIFPVSVQVYAQEPGDIDLDKPQRELIEFAEKRKIPVLDLLPMFREHQNEDVFTDYAHLTPTGHQLVATEIYGYLQQR